MAEATAIQSVPLKRAGSVMPEGIFDVASAMELLAALPNAVVFLDRDWRIAYANEEARRISRLGPDDLNHKTHWELYPETVGHPLEDMYREVMAARVAGRIEYHYEPFGVWLDVRAIPIDEGIALYYRDITDRKRAEALRDANARQLAQVLDASPESIVCIDREWNCSFVNRAAREILKADDLVGANLWTRFPANRQEPFASNYRTTMERRIPTEFEAYYAEPLDVWFKVKAQPFDDGIIIFSSNITDRKRAEALRDANARQLAQVLEATSDAVLSLDRSWTIHFINQNGMALVGRTDLVGKNHWEEFPAVQPEVYENYHRTMNDRVACSFETYYPEPLNRWFSVQSRPSEDGIVIFFRDIDEERRATQELLHKQVTLSFVQEAARVATWIVDLATEEIRFSSGSYPVYGRPLEEIRTLGDIRSLVLAEDMPEFVASGERAIASPVITSVDYRALAPDRRVIWLERRCLHVLNGEGVPTHLRGMTTDITVRKQNEERLAASEAMYRVLTDLNPQSIWMADPDGRILYVNQGFIEYTGLSFERLTSGVDWINAFDVADQGRVLRSWAEAMAAGSVYEIEGRFLRGSDGASRWWWLRALPVRDSTGKIQSWLGVAHDIQEAKEAAEELRRRQEETERQRAELETVYKTAPIGLALFDPVEFRYLRLNDRQAEIIGLQSEQILGRTLTEIAPIEGLREMFEQVARGEPIREQLIEGELPARPGEHRYWTVNYFPVYGADETIQAITAASLEITHQRKSELALIQSEKLAAVGRLASSISHEINNPLEAITNLLYLVATDPELTAGVKEYVDMAQSELSRVSQIATQTLRFHRQAVKPTLVTAGELVGAVLGLYHGRLSNSGIRVEAVYASQTRILCFENDIRQVLNNLIANAIDAMRRGGRLIVRAHDAADWTSAGEARRGVRITIADTGHGMSDAVRERVFEPFYTTKDLNGTGLGLWISAGIVQHHQGRMTVRSCQDTRHAGTVFTLFLPLVEEET